MKKLITVVIAAILRLGMVIPAFAAPNGWYEVSHEELGLPSEEEEMSITGAGRNKRIAISDDMYAAFFGTDHGNIDCTIDVDIANNWSW